MFHKKTRRELDLLRDCHDPHVDGDYTTNTIREACGAFARELDPHVYIYLFNRSAHSTGPKTSKIEDAKSEEGKTLSGAKRLRI